MEKTISISFGRGGEGDKTYAYKLGPGLTVKPTDKMVVQVGDNASCMVGIVTAVHDEPDPAATKWAFQLVDEALNASLTRG